MFPRLIQSVARVVVVLCAWHSVARAQDCPIDISRPACGKVCQLVCETKTLVAIGYGNVCKDICVPGPSRSGCKHCDICCGECNCDPTSCCQSSAPKCEFCWRDWFACGCTKPRSVKVLTKYQAEKKICWYHWKVVDAACCDYVGVDGEANSGVGIAHSSGSRSFYKPAPENAQLGDVLPVTDEDWVRLAAVLPPEPSNTTGPVAIDSAAHVGDADTRLNATAAPPRTEVESTSIAGRLERFFKK
jgi:hypothetical protein